MGNIRYFNGKRFVLSADDLNAAEANTKANQLRADGWAHVRRVPMGSGKLKRWAVYKAR